MTVRLQIVMTRVEASLVPGSYSVQILRDKASRLLDLWIGNGWSWIANPRSLLHFPVRCFRYRCQVRCHNRQALASADVGGAGDPLALPHPAKPQWHSLHPFFTEQSFLIIFSLASTKTCSQWRHESKENRSGDGWASGSRNEE